MIGARKTINYNYPFDNVNAVALYSLRKLRRDYNGAAISLRRLNDNATQDIGFNGANFDSVAANTFLNGSRGFIAVWYDQSGFNRHVSNTSQPSQPELILSEARPLVRFNGSSHHLFLAASFAFNTIPLTVKAVFRHAANIQNANLFSESTAGSSIAIYILSQSVTSNFSRAFIRNASNSVLLNNTFLSTSPIYDNQLRQFTVINNGSNVSKFASGATIYNRDFVRTNISFNRFTLGALIRTSAENFFQGDMYEICFLNSFQNLSLEINQRNFYGSL